MASLRRSPLAWALLGCAALVLLSHLEGATLGSHRLTFASPAGAGLRASTAYATHLAGAQGLPCNGAGRSVGGRGVATPRQGFPMDAPEATAAALGIELGEMVLGLAALYTIMSLNEYIYHRYFQHLGINKLDLSRDVRKELNLNTYKGDGHVEHHRETLDDMTLDQRPHPALDADPYRGTAFPWWASVAMTTSVLLPAYPVLSMLGWSGPVIVVTVVAALLAHALVWNSLHPHMHGLPDVSPVHGVPSLLKDYRDSALFNWLRTNHEAHHRTEGAHGNYNVCCPLMDQVVGTYVGEIPPQEVAASA